MTEEPKADFWDCNEYAEHLNYDNIEDAVEFYLDALDELPLGETIEVFGYEHMKIDPSGHWPDSVLEDFLCNLDENYGDPDSYTDPTEKMKKAAQKFVEVVLEEYAVWACKQVCSVKIDVTEWVKENRPGWLEEKQ